MTETNRPGRARAFAGILRPSHHALVQNRVWVIVLSVCALFSNPAFWFDVVVGGHLTREPWLVMMLGTLFLVPPVVAAVIAYRTTAKTLARILSRRADSEHEQIMIRIVFVTVILAHVFGLSILSGVDEKIFVSLQVAATMFGLSWLFLIHLMLRPGTSTIRRLLGIVVDTSFLSAFLHVGGEALAVWYMTYLWVTFGNGFRYGVRFLFASSAASFIGFAVVIYTTDYWLHTPYIAAGLLAALLVLPAYVARLIAKLTEAKAQAEEASRAKSRFLATMSHELRTPLTAIIGMSELLQASRLGREQQEMASTVNASAHSLLSLITDILDFSKIEAAKLSVDRADFDVHEVVATTRAMLRGQAEAKGLVLRVHVDPWVPRRVLGDSRRLHQVLTNLVANAVKFTESGEVTIELELIGRQARQAILMFRVRDTGIGVAPEKQARIFESFTQADDAINRRFGGTGLGLAISRQLVELMGGSIGLESEAGVGSVFWVSLPFGVSRPWDESVAPVTGVRPILLTDEHLAERVSAGFARPEGAPRLAVTAEHALALIRGDATEDTVDQLHLLVMGDPSTDARSRHAVEVLRVAQDLPRGFAVAFLGLSLARVREFAEGWRIDTVLAARLTPEDIARAAHAATGLVGAPSIASDSLKTLSALTAFRSYRVLLAEDNRTNRRVISKILEQAGHQVVVASDGEKALDMLEAGGIDIVLMDMNMPEMSGLDVARMYRFMHGDRDHVPIIALTAEATEAARQQCVEAGMEGFLTKPVEARTLLETIERLGGPSSGSDPGQVDASVVTAIATHPDFVPVEEAVVDEKALDALQVLGDGADFFSEVITEFLSDAEDIIVDIEASWATNDLLGFKDHAHSLRSSAAHVGATRMVKLLLSCRDVTQRELPEHGGDLIRSIREEFRKVRVVLGRYVAQTGASRQRH